MIWELLAGRPPFERDNVSELFRRKFDAPVPPLREYRPDEPGPIGFSSGRRRSTPPIGSRRWRTSGNVKRCWPTATL
jgi:hypothetical protein